jgi:DNA invertase Pin-like site-specific DNA recombinase
MQKLLAAACAKSGAPFRAILVDDLSRLSRDLGNTWQIVFHDLASAQVKVVDVTTGMASDNAGARLTFGAMALVNDTFLQLVRAETHRGLEGRALGGFWTGGRCYGYATAQEDAPPDPDHPRKRSVIDPDQAAIVQRVFRLFADGVALKRIAAILNEEGLAAPNDGGRGNKEGHGWGHTTIRAMLSLFPSRCGTPCSPASVAHMPADAGGPPEPAVAHSWFPGCCAAGSVAAA